MPAHRAKIGKKNKNMDWGTEEWNEVGWREGNWPTRIPLNQHSISRVCVPKWDVVFRLVCREHSPFNQTKVSAKWCLRKDDGQARIFCGVEDLEGRWGGGGGEEVRASGTETRQFMFE